jgi:hypothetical protein
MPVKLAPAGELRQGWAWPAFALVTHGTPAGGMVENGVHQWLAPIRPSAAPLSAKIRVP